MDIQEKCTDCKTCKYGEKLYTMERGDTRFEPRPVLSGKILCCKPSYGKRGYIVNDNKPECTGYVKRERGET